MGRKRFKLRVDYIWGGVYNEGVQPTENMNGLFAVWRSYSEI